MATPDSRSVAVSRGPGAGRAVAAVGHNTAAAEFAIFIVEVGGRRFRLAGGARAWPSITCQASDTGARCGSPLPCTAAETAAVFFMFSFPRWLLRCAVRDEKHGSLSRLGGLCLMVHQPC